MSKKLEQSKVTGPESDKAMAAAFDAGVSKPNDPGRSPTEPYDVPAPESAAQVAKNAGAGNV